MHTDSAAIVPVNNGNSGTGPRLTVKVHADVAVLLELSFTVR